MSETHSDRPEDDKPINVAESLSEANKLLPIDFSKMHVPLEMQMRVIALTIAQKHMADTIVRDAQMYHTLKAENKLGGPVSLDMVVNASLVFERYLWGQWSKGLAESAMQEANAEMSVHLEELFQEEVRKRRAARAAREQTATDVTEEDMSSPVRPSEGNAP